jgi:hypothetical protein
VNIFQNLLRFFLNHIPVSWNCDIYQHSCSHFIIAYYNVWLVTGDGPVSFYLLVPQYGYIIIIIIIIIVIISLLMTLLLTRLFLNF